MQHVSIPWCHRKLLLCFLAAPWNECAVIILCYLLQHLSRRSFLWDEWLFSKLAVLIRVTALNYTNTESTQEMIYVLKHYNGEKMAIILQMTFFKCIFVNEKVWISNKISLKFVLYGLFDYKSALVHVMAWCQNGDKLLSERRWQSLLCYASWGPQIFLWWLYITPVMGGFPSQRVSNMDMIPMSQCLHESVLPSLVLLEFIAWYSWENRRWSLMHSWLSCIVLVHTTTPLQHTITLLHQLSMVI